MRNPEKISILGRKNEKISTQGVKPYKKNKKKIFGPAKFRRKQFLSEWTENTDNYEVKSLRPSNRNALIISNIPHNKSLVLINDYISCYVFNQYNLDYLLIVPCLIYKSKCMQLWIF